MKIRVLEVLATLQRAGAERMAVSLAGALDRSRFEVRVVSLYGAFPGGFEPVLGESGIPVSHLGKRRGFDPRMYPRLRRLFREFRPDIVHTHSYVMRYTLPASLSLRPPSMVHTVHNLALKETDLPGRWLHRAAYRLGVVPVAVGEEVARSFESYYGCTPRATIPNGIDLSPYSHPPAAAAAKRALGFTESSRLAVSVARLDLQKDPATLLEAFAKALGPHREWNLVLAGEGSLRGDLEQAAGRLGLEGRIRFLGVVPNVSAVLEAADLFVLASRWEGTPLAVMEAMAAGLPVVATRVGGVPGLVESGVSGLLVEPGDTERLVEALARLALNDGTRRRFGVAARKQAERFGLEAMAASYAALFEECTRGLP